MRFQGWLCCLLVIGLVRSAPAQHLWWGNDGNKSATCAYGQITVYATHVDTYYCGINWHPGEPAGGYCGIQHNSATRRCTIFSVWDTTKDLHPAVTAADEKAHHSRFGNEGEGAHTDQTWDWKEAETFEYYLAKSPGQKPDTTDCRYYVFDRAAGKWEHAATITSPNGGHRSVGDVSSGPMAAFLENWSGKDKTAPRLATYRLWLGASPETLKPVTKAGGDGRWGVLDDCFYLADGSAENLGPVFEKWEPKLGNPTAGVKGKKLEIKGAEVDPKVVAALKDLPAAKRVD